ncbi:MAG: PIN domain-containing protein [Candidatus Micrarchaeota archaeon]
MKEILVDTSVMVDFLKRTATDETKNLLGTHQSSISMVTYYEICRHFLKISRLNELEFVKQQLYNYKTYEISREICVEAAKLSHSHNLSVADSMILATAKLNDLEVATRDSDLLGLPGVIFLKQKK